MCQLHRRQLFERLAHDEVAETAGRRILESLDATVDFENEVLGVVDRAADDGRDDGRDDDRFLVLRHQTLGPDHDRMYGRVRGEGSLDT